MVTYRGLGFDPTPGSVDAVARTVAQLRAAADALSAVEPALRTAARQSRSWQGEAAEAFRARLAAPATDPAPLRAAIPVLERWAGTLVANQRRTEELDARAVRLRRQLDAARDDLQDRQNALDLASTSASAAGASIEVSGAANRVAELEAALAEVLDEARTLEREHLRAADEAADALTPGTAPAAPASGVLALADVLGTASRTSATLAGLIAPGAAATPPSGAGSAVAAALARGGFRPSGELIVFGATALPASGS